MKGVIVSCLAELITTRFGKEKWQQSLQAAGLDKGSYFLATQDVDDAIVFKVVGMVCKVTNLTASQAADAFGDYWVNDYAPRIYQAHFRGVTSARDFLLKMDQLHETVTRNVANAKPPRFTYKWKNDRTLVMGYKSTRGMIDWLAGLVKGVGRHFNERLSIRKTSETELEVVFS
jgi:methyl-accepting chemotaxis protein